MSGRGYCYRISVREINNRGTDMRNRPLFACAVLMLCAMKPTAEAHVVTLEPDAFAAGTDVSAAWAHEGITMQAVFGHPTFHVPLLSIDSPVRAVTGSQVFGYANPWGNFGYGGSFGAIHDIRLCYFDPSWPCPNEDRIFAALRVDFERPVDFIEAFGSYSVDPLGMILLGADGRILERVYTHTFLYTENFWNFGSTQIQRQSRDIYAVVIGGVIGSSALDMIRVNVPEPGAFALLTIGLLGISLARRTRSGAR